MGNNVPLMASEHLSKASVLKSLLITRLNVCCMSLSVHFLNHVTLSRILSRGTGLF